MAVILVVRTLDVNYATVDGAAATASFDGGAATAMTRVDAGALELAVDEGVKKIAVSVTLDGFFPVEQKLDLDADPGGTPTLALDGRQVLGVRNLDNHSRDGGDHSVEVVVVLGQLRNGSTRAQEVAEAEVAKKNNVFLSVRQLQIIDLEEQVLEAAGATGTFKHGVVDVTPTGGVLLIERIKPPKMILVYVPEVMQSKLSQGNQDLQKVPIAYHVFFHPSTGHFAPKNYPFSFDYLDLIARYAFYEQRFNAGKAMVNQHDLAGKQVVFVFPIGGRVDSFGDAGSQAGLLRLLQEINYVVQRAMLVPFPLQPVGKVAISGFSAGIETVAKILASPRIDLFHDELLSEVYSFDGMFMRLNADKKFFMDVEATNRFINHVKSWLRNGEDDRIIRIYTQAQIFLNGLQGSIVNPTVVKGKRGATEVVGDNGTVLHTPPGTWLGMDADLADRCRSPGDLSRTVHQMIPAMFMQHAIKFSKLHRPPGKP
ncbi:hypothetical protein BH09PSE6_BH09PSE6_13280 [soil metagenome]